MHRLWYLLVFRPWLQRLQGQAHVAVLALAASLLDVFMLRLGSTTNGLAIGHLRLAYVRLHAEFPLHALHHDLQMELAHAGNDGFAGFRVRGYLESGVFVA